MYFEGLVYLLSWLVIMKVGGLLHYLHHMNTKKTKENPFYSNKKHGKNLKMHKWEEPPKSSVRTTELCRKT